jgi:flagellar export protein FliJ
VAIDRRENLKKAIILQAQGVEAARERLREAYLELKKYEVAEERREAEVAAEFAKQEQAELDEVGLVNHIRKDK